MSKRTGFAIVISLSFLSFSGFAYSAPRKTHSVVLGAVKHVPYSQAGDPAGAAAGENTLNIRALLVDGVLREWTTGDAHDVTDRSLVVRRVIRLNDLLPTDKPGSGEKPPGGPLGVAARPMAARGSRERPHHCAEVARLRPRREPGKLVSRLCCLLRRNGNRQEHVCRGGAGGCAQAGAGQETRGLRR